MQNNHLSTSVTAIGVTAIGRVALFLTMLLIISLSLTACGFANAQDATAETDQPAAAATTTAAAAAATTAAQAAANDSALPGFLLLGIVIALFVVPLLLGNYFSKSLRMPDYSWKFAVAIGTLAAAAVVVSQGEIKFGPDLSGGITLIYELQDTSAEREDELEDDGSGDTFAERSTRAKRQLVKQLIGALSERVDPSGTKEVTIREYGLGQIEIIIPKASQQELEFIERRIYTAGALEFRITASPVFSENREIIDLAKALPPGENVVRLGDTKVAEWMAYKVDEFGPVDRPDDRLVKRMAGSTPQALLLMNDGLDVTGEYLKSSSAGVDERGRPQVRFTINPQGAFRMGQLTGSHLENASGQGYHLGVILDKKLLTAPVIRGKISSQGEISGDMGKEEVDFIVGILNAGSLPATLNKDPISREMVSPGVGAETVTKARTAITYSLIAVMIFMLIYYRFAGLVACLALGANLMLILGLMVLFHAAFTLPGLAGLVLTIGMSVDANVLIFERIREERNRGAAMRMAIRNGFARATRTIVDANVTTLITAVVIYKIAPDNVKGFGVTLIIGIVMSMYAAIFLSRLVFDVAEKVGRIKELSMGQIIGQTSIDFLAKRSLAMIASLLLIGIGLSAVYNRGADLLNIDFTGGSSVTMVLNEGQEMEYSAVKSLIEEKTDLGDKNLSLVAVGEQVDGKGDTFKVSCVEQDVNAVQETLHQAFGDKLKTYQIKTSEISPLSDESASISPASDASIQLVNFQEDTAATEGEEQTKPASDAETTTATEAGDPFAGGSSFVLDFEASGSDAGISHDAVRQLLQDALDATGHSGTAMSVSHPDHQIGSAHRFTVWNVKLALPEDLAREVIDKLEASANSQPIFPLANKIGGRVAGDMTTKAIAAILISLLGIIAYIWIRFQHVMYGVAAVVALIHDVLVTLGMIALSAWFVSSIPALADSLMIEKFQISLPIVAAFLTIIGYSLNDTIVVFDRIREVKGKSPNLSAEMINSSINQTLSRTLLTSLTTFLSVILLYFLGGDGIHGFAFALVIGVIVGTYSSIFIASPVLLWMSQRAQKA
ncbi:MAG: protein translocase subunit SecD [Planctomycetes bacterium]|nr:protein translocase subunit SecD [Planctomycetota bacterium]